MRQGRFGGLLLAVMFAASTLQVAVDARRTFNKCCEQNEHLYYNIESGVYECETASQSAERAERVGDDNEKSEVIDDDDDAEFGKFLAKLSEIYNDSLTRDDVVASVIPSCVTNDVDWLFANSFRLKATPDDVTLHTLRPSRRHEFPAHAWCVDVDDEDDLMAVLCPCEDGRRPCVRKCCRRGEAFNEKADCVETAVKPWTPTTQNSNSTYYLLVNKVPKEASCEHHSIATFHSGILTLLPDGSMKGIDTSGRDHTFKPGRYCAENAASNDTEGVGEQLVLFCIEEDKVSNAITIFKGVVTLLGALALLITVVLTAIFPEMRQNIHGKMALRHNVALLGAFLCVGVAQVSGNIMTPLACQVLSFVMQYTLLAAFFWLNVMCVEVSWVFSTLRPVKKVMAGYVDMKFRWYSLYAWGTTTLISIVTMLVEFVPGAKYKPRFGESNCFFHSDDKIPQLLFLYGPMAILLSINLALFIFTATRIITYRRQTLILKTNDSNTNNRNKQNLILYVKLFTLMGVTWVFEIVSWVVGGKNYYWLPIDCINLLRGIFIFFIFCCKRSVLDLVRERLGCAGAAVPHVQSSAGTKPTAFTNDGFELTEATNSTRRPQRSSLGDDSERLALAAKLGNVYI